MTLNRRDTKSAEKTINRAISALFVSLRFNCACYDLVAALLVRVIEGVSLRLGTPLYSETLSKMAEFDKWATKWKDSVAKSRFWDKL